MRSLLGTNPTLLNIHERNILAKLTIPRGLEHTEEVSSNRP